MASPWEGLASQCRGRALTAAEMTLAETLEQIFADGVTDFDEVARRLTAKAVPAPSSNAKSWTRPLLERELSLINRSLDDAYARGEAHG